MRWFVYCALVLVLAAFITPTVFAQLGDGPDTADARIRPQLDQLGINYDIDEDGDYRVLYETKGGRTQIAFVRSKTYQLNDLEIREIWSIAYVAPDGNIPMPIANMLLEDSFIRKLGAWVKYEGSAMFVAKISAKADNKTLLTALEVVLNTADEIEEKLSGATDAF